MTRLRFTGPSPVQLPTPLGYLVRPGDVIEVPEHLLYVLRQANVTSVFNYGSSGVQVMPPPEHWQDGDAPYEPPAPLFVPEPEPVAVEPPAAVPAPVMVVTGAAEPEPDAAAESKPLPTTKAMRR